MDAEDIPPHKLQSFVWAFRYFPNHTFLWQLDMSTERLQGRILDPIGMQLPKNVIHRRWIPTKQLLADPKVLAIITHGGASTCLEAAYSGIPIFGISLHSDQYYTVHRLSQRGLGVFSDIVDVDVSTILWNLRLLLENHDT